jgi:hypothetical protein
MAVIHVEIRRELGLGAHSVRVRDVFAVKRLKNAPGQATVVVEGFG